MEAKPRLGPVRNLDCSRRPSVSRGSLHTERRGKTTPEHTRLPRPLSSANSSMAEPVTVDTFVRAETDAAIKVVHAQGGFGVLHHLRALTPIDEQTVIRMNRDTLYSTAVLDLSEPATVTLPEDVRGRGMADSRNRQSLRREPEDHLRQRRLQSGPSWWA